MGAGLLFQFRHTLKAENPSRDRKPISGQETHLGTGNPSWDGKPVPYNINAHKNLKGSL